jgi:signal transduction histidine kinase
MKDWRGQEVGRLLLLHNVTEQKRAQAQLMEQERALAMLHERERLARELHDSLGQVLGYVSLQAQAIRKRAQGGDLPAVEAQLTRLAEVAQAAHADVRDSILSLNAGAGRAWSFQAALRQYLDAYRDQYGIRTELSLPEGWADGSFEPETEVQLLRVIQEALTNARKHGKPACGQVIFEKEDSFVRLTIQDDGLGFDLPQAASAGHYGLQFMRERAEQIGGRLRVDSQPGAGTRVIIEINHEVH